MQNAEKLSTKYFRSIDGLRLLASINIVLLHLEAIGGLNDLNGTPAWLFKLIKGPAFHASIFFLLGGFIFTTKFASQAENFKTLPFLKKRFSELYPLHFMTTIIMVVVFIVKFGADSNLSIAKLVYSTFIHLSFLYSFFPFFSYTFNTPSWALSAFFLCYLLFGPALRIVAKITSKKVIIGLSILCCLPALMWGLLYGIIGTPEKFYHFFHIFAPVRFFEFFTGMLLARFFQLTSRNKGTTISHLSSDIICLFSFFVIYYLLGFRSKEQTLSSYLAYHFYALPIYFLLLYVVASEHGLISKILGLSIIRNIGKSSFYPYLLHIPVISVFTLICERVFGYYKFLHSPLNITIFMVILYGASTLYVNKFRKKRKPLQITGQLSVTETAVTDKQHSLINSKL